MINIKRLLIKKKILPRFPVLYIKTEILLETVIVVAFRHETQGIQRTERDYQIKIKIQV